jgi:hypothetical protein
VSYGPHPLDEFFAIAMMKCITVDLRKHYKTESQEYEEVDNDDDIFAQAL